MRDPVGSCSCLSSNLPVDSLQRNFWQSCASWSPQCLLKSNGLLQRALIKGVLQTGLRAVPFLLAAWFEALTMQILITQGGLAGLRAGGLGVGEGLWTSAEGPRGSCPVLAAEAEAPRTRSVTLPLHADSAKGKGPRRARPMFQSAVSAGLGEGRAEEGWEGDRMGVGQHLQHLLICITTDTLLDQENGARNNKGEGDSLGGPLRFFFLAPTLPVLRARGQPPPPSLAGPWWGNVPIFAAPSPAWAVSPSQPPTSRAPSTPAWPLSWEPAPPPFLLLGTLSLEPLTLLC